MENNIKNIPLSELEGTIFYEDEKIKGVITEGGCIGIFKKRKDGTEELLKEECKAVGIGYIEED